MLNQKHHTCNVRTQQEGGHFRVYYQHRYPKGPVENRDTRRFNSRTDLRCDLMVTWFALIGVDTALGHRRTFLNAPNPTDPC